MREYCEKNDVPLDFISTHHYPTDVVLGYGVENSRNFFKEFSELDKTDKAAVNALANEFVTFRKNIWKDVNRGVLTEMAKRARKEAGNLPLFYTEWSSLAGLPSDGSFGASFIAKTIPDNMGLADAYSYWTFSDILEEDGFPSAAFHGGYGLLTLQNVAKAPYRAFQLLHRLGEERYQKKFAWETLDIYAFRDRSNNTVQLLCVNHQSLLHDVSVRTAEIELEGEKFAGCSPEIVRIDDEHANAIKEWERIGCPEYVTQAQVSALQSASELKNEFLVADREGEKLKLHFDVPPMGVALVTVYLK